MAFCSNCGIELKEGAKFCSGCGCPVSPKESKSSMSSTDYEEEAPKRQEEFAGRIIKCPNCGEPLNAFVPVCPVCGFELRGTSASNALKQFEEKLDHAYSVHEKAEIIKNFPVPNTKEDIWEFMIMAISNTSGDPEGELFDAWHSKIEQVYQKSQLVFTDDADRERIKEKYEQFNINLNKKKKVQSIKKGVTSLADLMPVFPQILIDIAWLISLFIILPLCRSNLDIAGTNGFQLLLMVDLIAGAVFVPLTFKCGSALPKLITVIGIGLSIVFLIPLCTKNLDNAGTNAFQLILILEIICIIVIVVRGLKKSKEYSGEEIKSNGAALIIAIGCTVLFTLTYLIGCLIHPADRQKSVADTKITVDTQSNSEEGIYTYNIRNYVGKNLASVGKMYGSQWIDEYGDGELRICIVTEDGMIVPGDNDEIKKGYTVVDQNIPADANLIMVNQRDSRGKPYSNLVDYQSYEEIILYVAPVGDSTYKPSHTEVSPTLDRHTFHIRDYVGRNAASFGSYYGSDRIDEYGETHLKLSFKSEDGAYVDASSENLLKQYIVTAQDIDANAELSLVYEKDSRGKEYDNLIDSQNHEEITLTVKQIDKSIIDKMPDLSAESKSNDSAKDYVELQVKYKVLSDGIAEITGYSGDGNHLTVDSKIDGHEVVRIGDSAFENCTTLEEILFGADVEEIGDSAFKGCTALESVSVPNETKCVGNHSFEGCTSLTSATLWGDPDIGEYAFSGCTALTEISIGTDTKEVGAHAFDGCTNLSSAIVWGDDTIIGKDAFANCPNLDRPIQE